MSELLNGLRIMTIEVFSYFGGFGFLVDEVSANGPHKVGSSFHEGVEFPLFVFVDGGHFLFERAERENLFYPISVSELCIVVAHSVGNLQ